MSDSKNLTGERRTRRAGGRGSGEHTAFPLAHRSQFGYDPTQVEAFLERARLSYEGAEGDVAVMTSAEVRNTAFPVKKHGYSVRYVDAALDRLEEVFFERERRARVRAAGEEAWWKETRELLSEVRGRVQRPRGKRFRRRGIFATGYRRSQVDALLDRIADMFERRELGITPAEVRDVVFHSQWRGYDEDQVDAVLDAVVELILSTR
ncbi:MAG: DivIVA domain-containing protein [Leucobacter sp.]